MKLPELKKRFNKKFVIRIATGVLMVSLVGTSFSAYTVYAAKNDGKVQSTEGTEVEETETEEELEDLLGEGISFSEKEIGKDETVYIIADSKGNPTQTIVSDHLINSENKEVLEDASSLTDIENVKGDEEFTQSGSKLSWQADGNDIYYQGTTTKEAPVTQEITYFLDGKEVEPEELAGQSGKVTIRFDYTNHEKVGDVYVPFAAMTGMVLNESFTNIEVENGKVLSNGDTNIVIGYALPGLKESLQIEDEDLEDTQIPDYFEVTADVENFELDMTMTMVANAANFIGTDGEMDLSNLNTLVDTLSTASQQLEEGSKDLADGLDTLQSNMGTFATGVSSLQNGIVSYTNGASELSTGIGSLKTGIDTLAGSTPAMVSGVSDLKTGSDVALEGAGAIVAGLEGDGTTANSGLVNGAAAVSAGVDTLATTLSGMGTTLDAQKDGVYTQFASTAGMSYDDVDGVVSQLVAAQDGLIAAINLEASSGLAAATPYYTGIQTQLAAKGINVTITNASSAATAIQVLGNKIAQLQAGKGQVDGAVMVIDEVKANLSASATSIAELQAGAAAVSEGTSKLAAGANSLYTGLDLINTGLTTLNDKTGTLGTGVAQLQSGANQLATGASTLTSNNTVLVEGVGTLKTGTDKIVSGVEQLDEGAHDLADGMVQFNEEGIERLVNAYNGDIKVLVERLQEVLDAGESYQSFTEVADGVNGSVKFVYKTEGICN